MKMKTTVIMFIKIISFVSQFCIMIENTVNILGNRISSQKYKFQTACLNEHIFIPSGHISLYLSSMASQIVIIL